MPIALDPEQRFPIVLDCDADKPAETRPTFYVKALSMREQMRMSSSLDAIFEDAKTTEVICQRTVDVFGQYVVGWSNMGPHEFGSADIRDFLTQQEAMEILRKIMANRHLTIEEKKS
jgi:hypothetical protein